MFKILLVFVVTVLLSTTNIFADKLDLSQFDLKADYALLSDGTDATGNYGDMLLYSPLFEEGAIFSWGCWDSKKSDSCYIATPQITSLSDRAFAIQIDFKLSTFGLPIFQAGLSWRFLGLSTSTAGNAILKTGSQAEEDMAYTYNIDEWYTATIIHNTTDSLTRVYINDELIFSKTKYLEHPANDNTVSNSDFSRGKAFFGYWRNLKIYSTDKILAVEDNENENDQVRIFPNPANSFIKIDGNLPYNSEYIVFNSIGKILLSGKTTESKSIDIQDLPIGIYYLRIENEVYSFIKN
jgi:type IX secretion system substrate protein